MQENLLLIIFLLFIVSMLVMLGQKLRISYPIFLVIGGLLISVIPGIPHVTIDPELVFLIFLPPLLYEAAWYTSWFDFWKNRRPISLLGFGLVLFTSVIVAYFSSEMIPNMTLALGFLLGGIISPPDAVAATSVLKGLKIPKKIVTILEGESLVNDASSLIVFRFALAAVISGNFVFQTAAVSFFTVTIMGIVIGLAVAHVFYAIHRWMPTSANIDTALTFMAPYFMYISAEHFHYSGVMAVVTGGLFLSYRSHEIFNYNSRIQTTNVWSTVAFVLNGLVFILIGLQLPIIVGGLTEYSFGVAIKYGLIISALTIMIRIVWVYPGTFLPRWLSKKVRERESKPSVGGVFLVSWAGMRGVVSLASALSIPLTLENGQPFPERNLILFITFIVILVTLVVQGLSLPFLIKYLNVTESDETITPEEQEASLHLRLTKVALNTLTEKYQSELENNELVQNLKDRLDSDIALTAQRIDSLVCDEVERGEIQIYNQALIDIIKAQRNELLVLRKERGFEDDIFRKQTEQLDLNEARLAIKLN
ncbi:MAG: Na+/H+ antiporter [Bacteroidota bacterium]